MNKLEKHKFIVNVSAIIHDGAKTLVIKRSMKEDKNPGKYGVPGGKMDHNDKNISEALAREVREEVGLEIKLDSLTLFESHTKATEDGQKLYIVFESFEYAGEVKIDPDEVEQVLWLTQQEIEAIDDALFTTGTKKLL